MKVVIEKQEKTGERRGRWCRGGSHPPADGGEGK